VRVRPAAVAGLFYPADPGALADQVDALLAQARPEPGPARPVAAIAPHAGYRYSGAVAATVHASLALWRDEITRVVVLGPAHFVPLAGMAVPPDDCCATPLGAVEIDEDARVLAAEDHGVAIDDVPHTGEHSLETQLPFIQRALGPAVRVLPVLVGTTASAAVAVLVSTLLDLPGTVVVVSTDLSHYLDQDAARERDARTAAAVLARDGAALTPNDACGYWPLRGLLHAAAERPLDVELLRLVTSADTTGDTSRVVGYGAFLLTARA
jgi:MEMO1 family protein